MDKAKRSQLIRGLWTARVGVALTAGFIPTARSEIRNETTAITATARAEMQDEIRDDELIGVESDLPFDTVAAVTEKESDSGSILTAAERKQLAREQWERLDLLTRPA